ncbi:DUF1304 domain-containing protein [Sphingorhabdus sp. YGSMI21]|uniref:DUF1304 domain-containing protein n=1 Tax=Sphingorhabdus sp. YGSMI21 TaxID=2077182 RepID=UPI000C1EEEF0|nr:DUF1304 domain-containing protein [Sphingorhabdus sp. YGSMI21]ATW02312.1 hypothetical protein CHN51_01255 [Sphingorhabdus sp. YGSMI21]
MPIFARIMIALVATLHLYIAWFGIFAWQAQGPATFPDLPASLFEPTSAMAANQGVYNLCVAAGLIWSLFIRNAEWQRKVASGFLLFVATAGIFGAWRVSPDIALVQAGPAVIGLLLLCLPLSQTRQ